MDLPPDRFQLLTEHRNPRSQDLHRLGTDQIVAVIQQADAEVFAAMTRARPQISALIQAAEPGFLAGGRLIYLGAGTSGRLGVLDASEAPPTFQVDPGRVVGLIAGGDAALRRSSEGREDDPEGAWAELAQLHLTPQDTVIGIAAGGTTPYTLGALLGAKRCCPQVVTALISCAPVRRPPGADHLVVLATGAEVVTGSTRMKAGTATKLALNTISTTLMVRLGKVYENLMVDLNASNAKLQDRAARIISALTGLERTAAFQALSAADGRVPVAILMCRLGLDRAQAQQRLAEHRDNLGAALAR